MGYDAIRLRSPYLGRSVVEHIRRQYLLRSSLDCANDEILYELFTGELLDSWDLRVSMILKSEGWMINKNERPELVPCDPCILIEVSVHKIKYGHNVHSAPNVFLEACHDFVALAENLLGTDLPVADWWTVHRVDVVSAYRLSKAACKEFFDGLQFMSFSCRKKGAARHTMAVYFAGKTATVRFYYRGTEFQMHNRGRLRGFSSQVFRHRHGHDEERSRALAERGVTAFQRLADSRLHVEMEMYSDKLQYDFRKHPRMSEVADAYLGGVFDTEAEKLLCEGKQAMTTVRESRAVLHCLKGVYGDSTGTRLYDFWSSLCTLSDEVTREHLAKTVFYRSHKQFEDAGVSWRSADVLVVANAVSPHDFSPIRTDPRLCYLPARDREEFRVSRKTLWLTA